MLAALPTPSIARRSFSLALFTISRMPLNVNRPDTISPIGPKNLPISFPKFNKLGNSFLIPPLNKLELNAIFFVATLPTNKPTLLALETASSAILA